MRLSKEERRFLSESAKDGCSSIGFIDETITVKRRYGRSRFNAAVLANEVIVMEGLVQKGLMRRRHAEKSDVAPTYYFTKKGKVLLKPRVPP